MSGVVALFVLVVFGHGDRGLCTVFILENKSINVDQQHWKIRRKGSPRGEYIMTQGNQV